ncbi:MAG: DUF4097 family beta strand repeat protein, partial [Clostridia bacterium]|nr:DUF4097 family beta strand repeat protein [Clostridia bacterium]
MSKSTKIWLIIAGFLIVVGSSIFVIAMFKTGWDFTKLSTVKFETNTYELNDDFNSISISGDTADVKIIKSETEKAKVICVEREKCTHTVKVDNETLQISVNNEMSALDYIGISFQSAKITIYLPNGNYSNLNVKSDTGDIEISKDFTFENINVEVSTGDIKCFASVTNDITLKASTGDIKIENLTVNSLSLLTSTGNVSATNLIVNEKVVANVSTGKVRLKNITCKNFLSSG